MSGGLFGYKNNMMEYDYQELENLYGTTAFKKIGKSLYKSVLRFSRILHEIDYAACSDTSDDDVMEKLLFVSRDIKGAPQLDDIDTPAYKMFLDILNNDGLKLDELLKLHMDESDAVRQSPCDKCPHCCFTALACWSTPPQWNTVCAHGGSLHYLWKIAECPYCVKCHLIPSDL